MGNGGGGRGGKDLAAGGGPIRRASGGGVRYLPYRADVGEGSSRGVAAQEANGQTRRILSFNSRGGMGVGDARQGALLGFMLANNVDLAFVQDAGQLAFGARSAPSNAALRFCRRTVRRET